ncbi:MAG: hypothetical protein JXJ17_10610 [Anaerolineae bacterium]|nr:hypothetical protein [Anaerolineae bacterium]
MNRKLVLSVLIAAVILSACSLTSPQPAMEEVVPTEPPPLPPTVTPLPPTPTPEPTPIPPTPTPEPTQIPPTPEPVEEAEAVEEEAAAEVVEEEAAESSSPALGRRLYATDFYDGWPTIEGDEGSIKPAVGGYLMEMQKHWALWSYTTTLDLDAFYAEIIVSPLSCPAGRTAYGILFQYQDEERFRYFIMSCEGEYFVVDRNLPGGSVLLSGTVPGNVDPTTGKHSLGVLVSSDSLQAFINGQSVGTASLEDYEPLSGDIGLFAESGDQEFSVLYERLEVYEAD